MCVVLVRGRRLVDTLTSDSVVSDECPVENALTHSPLLGNVILILVCVHFGTPPLKIENQLKVLIVEAISWRHRYRSHRGAGSSQSSSSILGSIDTAGMGWRDMGVNRATVLQEDEKNRRNYLLQLTVAACNEQENFKTLALQWWVIILQRVGWEWHILSYLYLKAHWGQIQIKGFLTLLTQIDYS